MPTRLKCPCDYHHPSCPRCGTHWIWLRHRGGHLGCPECGTWVFRLTPGGWVELLTPEVFTG